MGDMYNRNVCYIGWFFMLRASEYLPPPNPEHAPKRVLRGGDIVFYKERQVSSFKDADEVLASKRGQKRPISEGPNKAHRKTSAAICPVQALQAHARQNPVWISDFLRLFSNFKVLGLHGKWFLTCCVLLLLPKATLPIW